MGDLDIDAIRDEYVDDLRPTDQAYSIVYLDRDRPPSDPDAATKRYETDDLESVAIPPAHLGVTVIAYDADGGTTVLTEETDFPEAQDRINSAMKELQTDE